MQTPNGVTKWKQHNVKHDFHVLHVCQSSDNDYLGKDFKL